MNYVLCYNGTNQRLKPFPEKIKEETKETTEETKEDKIKT